MSVYAAASAWSEPEEARLYELIKLHGRSWTRIAQELGGGRTDNQCKNRFYSSERVASRRHGVGAAPDRILSFLEKKALEKLERSAPPSPRAPLSTSASSAAFRARPLAARAPAASSRAPQAAGSSSSSRAPQAAGSSSSRAAPVLTGLKRRRRSSGDNGARAAQQHAVPSAKRPRNGGGLFAQSYSGGRRGAYADQEEEEEEKGGWLEDDGLENEAQLLLAAVGSAEVEDDFYDDALLEQEDEASDTPLRWDSGVRHSSKFWPSAEALTSEEPSPRMQLWAPPNEYADDAEPEGAAGEAGSGTRLTWEGDEDNGAVACMLGGDPTLHGLRAMLRPAAPPPSHSSAGDLQFLQPPALHEPDVLEAANSIVAFVQASPSNDRKRGPPTQALLPAGDSRGARASPLARDTQAAGEPGALSPDLA